MSVLGSVTAALLACACLGACGCSGGYYMTVPDQLAPAGGQAAVVMRVLRREFAGLALPAEKTALRFQVGGGPLRAAFADSSGYAGASVPVPDQPGVYRLSVQLQDRQGDEASAEAPVYVVKPDQPIVAVDLSALPQGASADAKTALHAIAAKSLILYMTDRPVSHYPSIHAQLAADGYPDGPVMLWRERSWRIERDSGVPRLVVQTDIVSQLAQVRLAFPGLKVGIAAHDYAAKGFAQAGLKAILLGAEKDWTVIPAAVAP